LNKLYYGDNLEILRDKIDSEYIDLIYLDPPFQSGKDYNIIFKPETHKINGATAQIHTFEDTWKWGTEPEKEFEGLITASITREKPNQKIIELMKAMRAYLTECSMFAYLCMMAPRLLELKRVLKKTGSIYLHCDPTASHYLKLLMDAIFGVENFQNEIIWQRTNAHNSPAKQFCRLHDDVLFYTKTSSAIWHTLRTDYSPEQLKRYKEDENGRLYTGQDLTITQRHGERNRFEWRGAKPPSGRAWAFSKDRLDELWNQGLILPKLDGSPRLDGLKVYLDEKKGKPLGTIWNDIKRVGNTSRERLGYPTQKPEALLERIISASSNEGDIVLDPFCGCGTAVAVAESLNRRWIGIDVTYLAIDVIKKRLEKNGIKEGEKFEIEGEPTDVYSAKKLAEKDPFQFQIWCITKIDATPSERTGGDEGVDGIINYLGFDRKGSAGKGVIQVKGTKTVSPSMVRDLKGTMKSQSAEFGILVTLKKPTPGMKNEALKEGTYEFGRKKIPRIQLITVEDLFKEHIPLILPANIVEPYKKPRITKKTQQKFSLD